ncbi:MAG TPA: EamA family transporter [Ktedonobacteraceae bacterium]
MSFQRTSRRAFLLVVAASVSWGTIGVANQALYASSATNALSLTFWRLVIATPVFFLVSWKRLGRRLFYIRRRDLLLMMGMGCLMALSQAWYAAAIATTGVSVSTLVSVCTIPVMVALFSSLLIRERVTLPTLLALVIAVSGAILLVMARPQLKDASVSLPGVSFACLSACTYAGFILCGRYLGSSYDPLQINVVVFGAGALLTLAGAASTSLVVTYPLGGWLLLCYLGCIPSALGYALFQTGMRALPATVTSIVNMCEPLTAAVLAWFLFHERLGPIALLGAGLLLGAMAIILLTPQTFSASPQDTSHGTGPLATKEGRRGEETLLLDSTHSLHRRSRPRE